MTDDEVFNRALPDDVVEAIAIDAAQRVSARFGDSRFNQHIAALMLPILRRAIREAARAHPSCRSLSLTDAGPGEPALVAEVRRLREQNARFAEKLRQVDPEAFGVWGQRSEQAP